MLVRCKLLTINNRLAWIRTMTKLGYRPVRRSRLLANISLQARRETFRLPRLRDVCEPQISPRSEPFQKFGNNAGITTRGGRDGFAFFALKPTVEISAYCFIAEDSTVRNLTNIGNNLSCLPVGEQPHATQACGFRIPICDFLGAAFIGFFRGALTSATIRTDETGEPIARAGESAETCHLSTPALNI
jgi:hypothetical protein